MRFAESAAALLALLLRLIAVPPRGWATDWVAVFCLFWIATILTADRPRLRAACFWIAVAWLGALYAAHQWAWTTWPLRV